MAVIDFDIGSFPFSSAFRDALLSSNEESNRPKVDGCDQPDTCGTKAQEKTGSTAHAALRRQKKEKGRLTMMAFQQRLRLLPLSQLHLAVEPTWQPTANKSPLALPKGNISRFLMRRLRPLYTKFICDVVCPDIAAAMQPVECPSIYFQTSPCLRMNAPSKSRATHPHCDAMYFHQPAQINYWLPLTGTAARRACRMLKTEFSCNRFTAVMCYRLSLHPLSLTSLGLLALCADVYGSNTLWVESEPLGFDHSPLEVCIFH